ncbi:GDSL esterase/lipase [Melia azedarach]|uniref:GDSL esterase/lipase n=1 Tax=Melia azedarach TaxID=155640 RepID=A0ACC1WXI1_MELAZ|nr:GDSL esterase/lipase [Melia azedarach]
MAPEAKIWCNIVFVLLFVISNFQYFCKAKPRVPCYFIFGDSLADNGNNNVLPTLARANFPPYGIDFPTGATGRFSNGRTAFDIIGELLGFDNFIPPFTGVWTSDIMSGVNYASAAAGILDQTGIDVGGHFSMNMQLFFHQFIISHIIPRLGNNNQSAGDYLSKCLYVVNIGSNDYIRNYFVPLLYPTSHLFTPKKFAAFLIHHYSRQIRALHECGARKIALFGLGSIGCTPNAIATYKRYGSPCVEKMNRAVKFFNDDLKLLVYQLNKQIPDSKFTFINVSGITSGNLSAQGFKVIDAPCCQAIANFSCIPYTSPCKNRSEYWFWDDFHPTEATNRFVAERSYLAVNSTDVYPYDISHLISL